MTINEAVKLSIKENKCITRNGNLFPVYILPTDTTNCCIGFLKDENGNLIINEAEAEIVKWIFESYLSGYSLGRIANELYQKEIKSPTGRDKWSREAIDKLLSNEKYLGIVLLQKTFSIMGTQFENKGIIDKYLTRNSHSAIISIELFKKVQQAKVERGRGTKIGENTASDMLNVISML